MRAFVYKESLLERREKQNRISQGEGQRKMNIPLRLQRAERGYIRYRNIFEED